MDELKKYLQENRSQLDQDEPGEGVWMRIQQTSIPVKKSNVLVLMGRWSVAACLLTLAGFGINTLLRQEIKPVTTVASKQAPVKIDNTQQLPILISEEKSNSLVTKSLSSKRISKPIPKRLPDYGKEFLTNMEASFTQVINLQRARVRSMPMHAETPEYFNDFKVQIKQMEQDEKLIKSDIAKRGINETLLDQLINVYQQKLTLLKQLQTEMNKLNNHFQQNRGPVDSTRTYFLNI